MTQTTKKNVKSLMFSAPWNSLKSGLYRSFVSSADTLPSDAPKFRESDPWTVYDFRVEGDKLLVDIQDSDKEFQTLELPYDRVKLIQLIGQHTDPGHMKLYAEVRRDPAHSYFQAPHAIVYLGDVTYGVFQLLEKKLKEGHIDTVWYQTPRRERMSDLVPKSWHPNFS